MCKKYLFSCDLVVKYIATSICCPRRNSDILSHSFIASKWKECKVCTIFLPIGGITYWHLVQFPPSWVMEFCWIIERLYPVINGVKFDLDREANLFTPLCHAFGNGVHERKLNERPKHLWPLESCCYLRWKLSQWYSFCIALLFRSGLSFPSYRPHLNQSQYYWWWSTRETPHE